MTPPFQCPRQLLFACLCLLPLTARYASPLARRLFLPLSFLFLSVLVVPLPRSLRLHTRDNAPHNESRHVFDSSLSALNASSCALFPISPNQALSERARQNPD